MNMLFLYEMSRLRNWIAVIFGLVIWTMLEPALPNFHKLSHLSTIPGWTDSAVITLIFISFLVLGLKKVVL